MLRPETKILVDGGDPRKLAWSRNSWDLSMAKRPTHL